MGGNLRDLRDGEVKSMTVDCARPGLFLGNTRVRQVSTSGLKNVWEVFVASDKKGKTWPGHVKSVTFSINSDPPTEDIITEAPFSVKGTGAEAFEVEVSIEFKDGTPVMEKKHTLNFSKKCKSRCIQAPTARYFTVGDRPIVYNFEKLDTVTT